jgi:aerobic carbon-monoxide dehydrogenase small subunit
MRITFTLNGDRVSTDAPPHHTLLKLLRDHLHLTGTKECCGEGECGACTVLVNGQPVNSCLMLAVEAENAEVLTIEGLAQQGRLTALQQTFVEHGAVQCGFCIPGMIVAATALLDRVPRPNVADVEEALSGNLCRCAGYSRIIKAVLAAADKR